MMKNKINTAESSGKFSFDLTDFKDVIRKTKKINFSKALNDSSS